MLSLVYYQRCSFALNPRDDNINEIVAKVLFAPAVVLFAIASFIKASVTGR
jgi:hypothetical protein